MPIEMHLNIRNFSRVLSDHQLNVFGGRNSKHLYALHTKPNTQSHRPDTGSMSARINPCPTKLVGWLVSFRK